MIKHIAYSLATAFPDATVYRENVNKAELPFFDIKLIESRLLGEISTYILYEKYEIRYFPKLENDELSCRKVLQDTALQMTEVLEIMKYDDEKIRASEMKYRIEDNVLQFFLVCRKRIARDEKHPLVENLETKIERK